MTSDTVFSDADWRSGERTGESDIFGPGAFERNLERVRLLRRITERLGASLASLALRWALEQRGVTAVIAGTRDARHARANALAGVMRIDGEILEEVDAIFEPAEAAD